MLPVLGDDLLARPDVSRRSSGSHKSLAWLHPRQATAASLLHFAKPCKGHLASVEGGQDFPECPPTAVLAGLRRSVNIPGDTKLQPTAFSSSSVSTRWRRLRPKRSSFQTAITSSLRVLARRIMASSCGRESSGTGHANIYKLAHYLPAPFGGKFAQFGQLHFRVLSLVLGGNPSVKCGSVLI